MTPSPDNAPGNIPTVLFLDVEGGFGGSSRSMFHLIENLDRSRFSPVAVVRKKGPIIEKYKAIGVPCHLIKSLPTFRPGERKQAVSFVLFLLQLIRFIPFSGRLKALIRKHDVKLLHVNIESLALTGHLISKHFKVPWVCHIRTLLVPSSFARLVYRLINRRAERIIFITDQNMTHFAALTGKKFDRDKAEVVFNITPQMEPGLKPRPELSERPDVFKVISLSNFSPNRGVDRILDVAEDLKNRGEKDFVFFLYGQAAHKKLFSGGRSPYAEELIERVKQSGLEDMVLFPGHIDNPQNALAGGQTLIKLARDGCPWGRDLMEALAAGLPVIALGAYQVVVEHEVNGYLEMHFDPKRIADFLVRLKNEAGLRARMQKVNREKAKRLFSGPGNANQVERIYAGLFEG